MRFGITIVMLALVVIVKLTLQRLIPSLSLGVMMPLGAWILVTSLTLHYFGPPRRLTIDANPGIMGILGAFLLCLGGLVWLCSLSASATFCLYLLVGFPVGGALFAVADA